MPQYQGVWSVQEAARLQSQQQWVTDPYYKNTTLLLQADNAANSAQNNTFLDSSTNAFAITRNGNTTQGTFTPFSQTGWGNYFDGTSDYLNYGTNTNTQLGGATNFTIEAWVYPTAYNSYGPIVTNSASGTLGFGKLASGFGIRKWGTGDIVYTANTPPIGQWTHVAAVKAGNTIERLRGTTIYRCPSRP